MTDKKEIRRQIKKLRLALTEEEKMQAAERVFDRLEKSEPFIKANHILLYHSLPDELFTHSFLQKWGSKKQLYLPRVKGDELEILPYMPERLSTGAFQIEEPEGEETVNPEVLELIVVPGVAFDKRGGRIGRGKGYYDRLLAGTKAVKIAVAYHFQMLEEIPVEPHDVPMDMVITDKALYISGK